MNNFKRISIILSIAFIISIIGGAFQNKSYAKADTANIEKVLNETLEYMLKNKEGFSDAWAVIGMARNNNYSVDNISETYVKTLKKELNDKKGILSISKYSDYSKAIIALTSLGISPENVGGYNLLLNLIDMEKITIQGINGPLWALLAINSNNYTSTISKETLINHILTHEIKGGGWSLSSDTAADVDITAMVLTSISKYKNRSDVMPYIERGVEFLSNSQNADGGFETLSQVNSESSSQVIIALSSLGIDALNDSRFIKNNKSIMDDLIQNFYNGQGGFYHLKNGNVDKIATEQGFLALTAYSRFKKGEKSLYDMSDIKVIVEDNQGSDTEITKNPFMDIDSDDEKEAIIHLNKMGIIKGMTETQFQPNKSISRAELATLLARALGKGENQDHGFSDVKKGDWYSGYIGSAKQLGLINGYPDNTFKPNSNITREEAAMIIYNGAKANGIDVTMGEVELRNYLSQFPDYLDIAKWGKEALGFSVKKAYISNSILNIEPKRDATRSEVAGMLYRLLKDIEG